MATRDTKSKKYYNVMCIDLVGCGSWETVEYMHTDAKKHMHGYIERTGWMVEFWESENGPGDFIGTTYRKIT